MKSIGELLDEFEASRNEGRDPRVGPSDYGSCPRQIAYRVRGHEPGEPVESTRAATMGTLFWKGLGEFIAETHPDAFVEGRVIVPGLDRAGSYDLRWIVDGVLVDVKTVSARAYDFIVTRGAKVEHIGQVETYALGVNRAKVKRAKPGTVEALGEQAGHRHVPEQVHTLVLAYVNRDNGDVHEYEWAYDEASARERVSWLVEQEQMIDAGFDMPRAEGARLGAFPCDWCPFWRECWQVDGDVPDTYASKFTVDDAQVEDALERYFEQGEIESKAKRLKAEARDQLVGIEYATNGYKLSWSGGRVSYEDEIDYESLVVMAVEAGIEVPVRQVEKRTSRRINARRVSKS